MILGRPGKKPEWQMVDMHCHILPGLDDGARDMAETVSMLRIAASEGISDMIVTPHFHSGRFMASPEEVLQRLLQVQEAVDRERIPVRLYPGNEIYYFEDMASCLRQCRLCTMNGTRHVLVEFAPFVSSRALRNSLDRIRANGYFPVLAHAERYECLLRDAGQVVYLKDMGVQIQVNSGSVTGKNGSSAKKFVHWALRRRLADYIGTDAHSGKSRAPEMARCRDIVTQKYGREYAFCLTRGNAEKFFMIDESE